MNRAEVGSLLNNISKIWPNWEITDLAAEMWWQALAECPKDVSERTFRKWTEESKFPPTISEFRRLALQLAGGRFNQVRHEGQGEVPTPEGMVRVGKEPAPWCFVPKDDCVLVDGNWMRKVDFVVEMLSAGEVSKEFGRYTNSDFTIRRADYQQVLAELLIKAWAEHERRKL